VRFLHPIWDGGGNVAPQLALAGELAARGHEVRVMGDPCQEARVVARGLAFRAYRHAPHGDASSAETDLLRDWEPKTPIGAFGRVRDRLMYGPAGRFARDVLEALEEEPADAVVWDYLVLGAGLGAEKAAVRSVAAIHMVYPLPAPGVPPFGLGLQPAGGAAGRLRDAALGRVLERMFRPGLEPLNAARIELGLDPLDSPFDAVARADLALVMTSPAFDFAGSVELPPNVRYIGPHVDPAPPEAWESPWDADDRRPLVLASFSTTYMAQERLARRVVEALGELPVRGLVTTGPAIDAAALPERDNVALRRYVPHAAVLPEADLVVTHSGIGTVHAALAAGVPIVGIPCGRDQDDVAARVVFHGAGVRVAKGASASKLRRAIEGVLAEPTHRAAARALAQTFARERGAAAGADAIEQLVAATAPAG
jgi:MGT family glycosyltransferase